MTGHLHKKWGHAVNRAWDRALKTHGIILIFILYLFIDLKENCQCLSVHIETVLLYADRIMPNIVCLLLIQLPRTAFRQITIISFFMGEPLYTIHFQFT